MLAPSSFVLSGSMQVCNTEDENEWKHLSRLAGNLLSMCDMMLADCGLAMQVLRAVMASEAIWREGNHVRK